MLPPCNPRQTVDDFGHQGSLWAMSLPPGLLVIIYRFLITLAVSLGSLSCCRIWGQSFASVIVFNDGFLSSCCFSVLKTPLNLTKSLISFAEMELPVLVRTFHSTHMVRAEGVFIPHFRPSVNLLVWTMSLILYLLMNAWSIKNYKYFLMIATAVHLVFGNARFTLDSKDRLVIFPYSRDQH